MSQVRYQPAPIARVAGSTKAGGALPRVAEPKPGRFDVLRIGIGTQASGKSLLGLQGGAGTYFKLDTSGDTFSGEFGGYQRIDATADAVPGASLRSVYEVSLESSNVTTTGSIPKSGSWGRFSFSGSIGLDKDGAVSSVKLSLGIKIWGRALLPYNSCYSKPIYTEETPIINFGKPPNGGSEPGRLTSPDRHVGDGGKKGGPNGGSGGKNPEGGGPKPGPSESKPSSSPKPSSDLPRQPDIPQPTLP